MKAPSRRVREGAFLFGNRTALRLRDSGRILALSSSVVIQDMQHTRTTGSRRPTKTPTPDADRDREMKSALGEMVVSLRGAVATSHPDLGETLLACKRVMRNLPGFKSVEGPTEALIVAANAAILSLRLHDVVRSIEAMIDAGPSGVIVTLGRGERYRSEVARGPNAARDFFARDVNVKDVIETASRMGESL